MSSFIKVNTNTNTKKICKLCVRLGKSDICHIFKDEKGIIRCPTILSMICTYCGNKGHNPKHCIQLQKDKVKEERQAEEKEERQRQAKGKKERQAKGKKEAKKKSNNLFMALDSSSSSSEDEEEEKKEKESKSKLAPWVILKEEAKQTRWIDMMDYSDDEY